ncbi:Protein phosphatase 1 regulatory subunit 12B [Taenia solium]|eukprot:TsM_000251200 transcript=TsM_000251200 gene=TsM_000251200
MEINSESTEASAPSRSRYTTTGNPGSSNNSTGGGSNSSNTTTTSGYYSWPSPSYTSTSSTTVSPATVASTVSPAPSSSSRAAESSLDYKRLYEAERQDTQELRTQIDRAQQELRDLRAQIEGARRLTLQQQQRQQQQQQQNPQQQHCNDADQRTLEELRASAEKLKAEHRALTRVISRLM